MTYRDLREFMAQRLSDFSETGVARQLYIQLQALITTIQSLSAAQASGMGSARQRTEARGDAREVLGELLEAIHAVAVTMGLGEQFPLPGRTDAKLLQRARELIPEHRQTLESLPARLSQREALSQLIQSLDEATVHPTEEELSELFQELRADALPTLMGWLPRLNNERVRELVHGAAARLAQANAAEVLKALASEDTAAQLEMVKLAGRLKLPGAPDGMAPLLESNDRTLKLAVVDALTAIASPSAMRLLEQAIDDADRDVRIAAVRFLASRGYRNAAPRVESVVTGSKLKNADLTEKMIFFEAFGSLVGARGIATLEKMLAAKGLLGRKEDPETRACAAMALGKVRTPEARAVLERAAQDKEPLVRNAVSRALREVGG